MKAKSPVSKRAKLLSISEEMKQWSTLLEQELDGWPGVTSRSMFGLVGLYRSGVIYAALPRTRALSTPNSIIFRFDPMPPQLMRRAQKDPRITWERKTPGPRWFSFELNSADELSDVLWWLNQAYEKAK